MNKFLYQKIAAQIVDDALAVGLCAGDKLPTLEELVARHGVSAAPVRRALQDMCDSGKLVSRRGSGYFLTERVFSDKESGFLDPLGLSDRIPFMSGGKESSLRVGLVDGLPSQRRLWSEIVRRFKRGRPNLEISLEFFCNSPSLLKQLRDGSGKYDVMQLDQRQMLDAVEEDLTVPVPIASDLSVRLPALVRKAVQDGDALRGVPFSGSFPALLLNRRIFEEAKLSVPEKLDWNGYVGLVKSLIGYRAKSGGSFLPSMSSMSPVNYFLGVCGQCFDSQRGRFDWRRPEALDFFKDLSAICCRSSAIPIEVEVRNAGGFHKAFQDGMIGMLILCDFFLETFSTGCLRHSKILSFPIGDGVNLVANNFHVVDKNSKEKESAFEFLNYLLGDDCVGVARGAGVPHLADQTDVRFKNALPIIAMGRSNYDFISEDFNTMADKVRDGVITPKKALDSLAEAYEKKMEGEYDSKIAN